METYIVEGNISVKAVLQAKRRVVQRIVVDAKKKDKDTSYILRLAKKQGITIQAAQRHMEVFLPIAENVDIKA